MGLWDRKWKLLLHNRVYNGVIVGKKGNGSRQDSPVGKHSHTLADAFEVQPSKLKVNLWNVRRCAERQRAV